MNKGISRLMLGCVGALLLTSCNSSSDSLDTNKTNWEKMNYNDYDTLYVEEQAPAGTEGYWDYWETKKVSYQFINDRSGAENHGFANYFPTLLNLYEDGSIKGWERCIFIPSMFDPMVGSTGSEEQNTYNDTYKLLELFYGYWAKSGNTLTINVQSSVDYDSDGANVQYTQYTCDTTPNSETKKFSFYFNCTEKGQAIKSLFSCDTSFEGTIQYTSYANFALGHNVNWVDTSTSSN